MRNLAYCKLYDEGKKRIGCVFCPFARERENIENALKYPQFVRYFITACGRAIKTRLAKGKDSKYKTGEEMFVSWIEGGRGKKLKDFGVKFDYEKGEIVMENEETSTTAVVSTENGSSEGNLPAENSNAVKTTPTLEQRVVKIQFHLQNMANSAIIIGQELIECKKEVGHGNWADWLKENFNLSQRTARQFMQIYERFGANSKWQTSAVFNYSQMAELLALPAGEEENFIAEKAAEGSPVEDMTVKKLRKEIKDWKKKAAEKETEAESLKKENEELKKDNAFKLEVNRSNAEEYFKLRAEKEKEISELQDKINALQKQLENPTVEILPADDEEKENLRKEVAALKAREENFREEIATSQALNQFFMMANFLQEHQNCLPEVIKGYVETDGVTAERINQIAFISNRLKKILNEENSGNKKS